jgi:hypothetical protein
MININNNCNGQIPVGFFANFLITIDWIHNSLYNGEKIFINWTCNSPENLWNHFFEQPNFGINDFHSVTVNNFRSLYDKKLTIDNINNVIKIYDKYNGWFYNNVNIFYDENFQNLRDEFNKSYNSLILNKKILSELETFENKFNSNVLGVAVRIPSHYTFDKTEGVPTLSRISAENFYEKICDEIFEKFNNEKYEKIFVCCDVEYFLNLLKNKFGDEKLIYTKYDRIKTLDGDWVDKRMSFYDEYRMALIDCLLLSKCKYVIGGSSNIFLTSLIINNKVNFKIFNLLSNSYGL